MPISRTQSSYALRRASSFLKNTALTALAAAISLSVSSFSFAESTSSEKTPDLTMDLAAAEANLKASFSNFAFTDFKEGPMPGLFEAHMNGRVVYYHPGPPELMFFGQIFDTNGQDLTAFALQEAARARTDGLDLSTALSIGNPSEGSAELVEFTNPDCGFCRGLDVFLRSRADEGMPIHRKVVFTARDPRSQAKAEHILCADDPDEAFRAIYAGEQQGGLQSCPEGKATLEAHLQLSDEVGVSGTPTLLADGKLIVGFRQGEIEAFLQSSQAQAMAQSER